MTAIAIFPDRALPFLLSAWVYDKTKAAAHYACLDLPSLEEDGAELWRTDRSYRLEIKNTVEALATTRQPERRESYATRS